MAAQELLTVSEIARRLRKSESVVKWWLDRGLVNVVRDSAGRRLLLVGEFERLAAIVKNARHGDKR